MPQMAPLNWLSLMLYFTAILLILNSLNFYTFLNYKKIEKPLKTSALQTNWKWL